MHRGAPSLGFAAGDEVAVTVPGPAGCGSESHGDVRQTTLTVPDAVGPVEICANLRSRQTFTSVSVDAPHEGRTRARFNWILRQLRDASDELMVEAAFPNARSTTAARLGEVREDPAALYYSQDPKRERRSFVITRAHPMGQKRGRAEGSFVRETSAQAVEFYRDLVQELKGWQAPAPRLRAEAETVPDASTTDKAVVPARVGEERATPSLDGDVSAEPER